MLQQPVHELFEEIAVKYPQFVAVEANDSLITYAELNGLSNSIGEALIALGTRHEEVVSVILPSGIGLVATMMACFKTQNVYMPMDLRMTGKRLATMLSDTNARIIITNNLFKENAFDLLLGCERSEGYIIVLQDDYSIDIVDVSNRISVGVPAGDPLKRLFGSFLDADAYIFYTSGSTSDGKAILGSHKSLSHFIQWEINEIKASPGMRIAQVAQITFDASLKDILTAVCSGATVCIAPRENLAELHLWLRQKKITVLQCVPSIFRFITRSLQDLNVSNYLPDVKLVVLAGEMMFERDIVNWQRVAGDEAEIINMYGATESTILKTFNRIHSYTNDPNAAIPIGVPIADTVLAIIKAQRICKLGEIGELYIRTPYLTKGYYKNEELTSKIFVQNPLQPDKRDIVYKTGDLARYLEGGQIEIIGRIDDVVKINGVRVDLQAIANFLKKLDGIGEVVILQLTLSPEEKPLVCYYSGIEMDQEVIIAYLLNDIEINLLPNYFIHLLEWPLNLNGKLDRKALPRPSLVTKIDPPVSSTEVRLAIIWQDLLNAKEVGRNNSFFSLGGHSIKAIQLISRIAKEFNVSLSLGQVFEYKTIRELALCIEASQERTPPQFFASDPMIEYDLSQTQKGLWFMDQMTAHTGFNISIAFRVNGTIDLRKLQVALQETITKHESLRTNFIQVDGVPKQRVVPAGQFQFLLESIDLESIQDNAFQVSEIVRKASVEPFDLESELPIRAKAILVSQQHSILIVTLHHLVADGWSMGVLLYDIVTIYNSFFTATPLSFSPLPFQYRHYVQQQKEYMRSEQFELDKQFWIDQLSGSREYTIFPYDFEPPQVRNYAGKCITYSFTENLSRRVLHYSREVSGSVFITMTSAVQMLLRRLTASADIIIGTTIADRNSLDLENQIGFYVNTMPIRTIINELDSFKDGMQKVRYSVIESFKHRSFPFGTLVEHLRIPRNASASPLFGILIEVLNTDVHDNIIPPMHGTEVSRLETETQVAQYDLAFRFVEEKGGLAMLIEFNTDLYKPETIEVIRELIVQVLHAMTSDDQVIIADMSFANALEKN